MRRPPRQLFPLVALLLLAGMISLGLTRSERALAQESPNALPSFSLPGAVAAPQLSETHLSAASFEENQQAVGACTTITFEGVGDMQPIPEFDGITSPDWLGSIDADADGTGNFAHEPSPSTTAFWLGGETGTGSSRDIRFRDPVATVEFYYASAVQTRLQAFDANGNQVASTSGPANAGTGPGGDPNGYFNKFDLLKLETSDNKIAKITVSGAVNQTGIDNLKVCKKATIHSVEVTQATQQWQTLAQLKASLAANGSPPIKIVANKPAVLRVYMNAVSTVTQVRVQVSGAVNSTKTITLQPACTPEKSRKQKDGCSSADFYFTPPGGQWSVTVRTLTMNDLELEHHNLTMTSVAVKPLTLIPVTVCRTRLIPIFGTVCEDGANLEKFLPLMRATYPTNSVKTGEVRTVTVPSSLNGTQWWWDTVVRVNGLWTEHGPSDAYYHGLIDPDAPGSLLGIAFNIGSGGAAISRVESLEPGVDFDDTAGTVAHETGHLLGRRHTNKTDPSNVCILSPDPDTDWPYGDNRIQEVGFNVATRTALDPASAYDWISYCRPPFWVSPHTYSKLMERLQSTSAAQAASSLSPRVGGDFWYVAGVFEDGTLALQPLFVLTTQGPTSAGSGSHRIEVVNDQGNVLFTRFFNPVTAETRTITEELSVNVFAELVPVQTGAAALVVRDTAGAEAARITLQGSAPSVTITAPQAGATLQGTQQVAWQITDPDSTAHTSRLYYSPDNGATLYSLLTDLPVNDLPIDFNSLPGCTTGCLLRVLVSDGVNTGVGEFRNFSVPTKNPAAQITFPSSTSVMQPEQLLWLQGSGLDPENGALSGAAMSWVSSIDGPLGTGNEVHVTTLSEGTHTINLTVTDSDGNKASDSTVVQVDGTNPLLTLTVIPDGTPASCVFVAIEASDEAQGSGLRAVEYSTDAGTTWTGVNTFPALFFAPGEGFIHLVVRVSDNAGNTTATDQKFFIDTECSRTPPTTLARNYLPLISRKEGPKAVFLSAEPLATPCEWGYYMQLTGFAPNSRIFVTSTGTELNCTTGETSTGTWSEYYYLPTDAGGSLIVAYRHGGTGTYTYSFKDEKNNYAEVTFTTTP